MPSPLRLAACRPTGRLGTYIGAFQVFSLTDPAGVSVLDFGGPDTCVPVCFGDPVLVEDVGRSEVPSAAVVGPRKRATWLRFQGAIDQVNIWFLPGAVSAFIDLPVHELTGRTASPDDVWPREFQEAVAELTPLPTRQRIRALEKLLLARLEPSRQAPPQVREAIRLIQARHGQLTIGWLADQVNLSISQLERGFARYLGVGPKLATRQARVCAFAAEATGAQAPNWASLANKHGYADQAHLTRELRELTGLTPARFGRVSSDADFLQDAIACCRGE